MTQPETCDKGQLNTITNSNFQDITLHLVLSFTTDQIPRLSVVIWVWRLKKCPLPNFLVSATISILLFRLFILLTWSWMCEYACMYAHTHTEVKLVTAAMGGERSLLKSVSLTATITYIQVFCIYNKHASWIYQANLAHCCLISAVQPFSTQCGPTFLLNNPIWYFSFLDLTAPPPAWRLMTSLLNKGLYWTNTPIWRFVLSSAQPQTNIIFTATRDFWTEVGCGRTMDPGTFCQPKTPYPPEWEPMVQDYWKI
jgi:hypothetical protein